MSLFNLGKSRGQEHTVNVETAKQLGRRAYDNQWTEAEIAGLARSELRQHALPASVENDAVEFIKDGYAERQEEHRQTSKKLKWK